MLTSLRDQKFIRNPNAIVSPRPIFKRRLDAPFKVATKEDPKTEVGFEWLFKILFDNGSDILGRMFSILGFTGIEVKNTLVEGKDKFMQELKELKENNDTKDVMLFILGNVVFRVPIGIGQATVWIMKWLGNSIEVGRTVRYRETPILTYNAIVTQKIPIVSETPKFLLKDTGDLESIGSYTFRYEIEFIDATGKPITRIVDRKDLDVDSHDFMKFAWKKIVEDGIIKIGRPIYDDLLKIGKAGLKASIDVGKAGLKASIDLGKTGLATTLPALAGIGSSIKSSICGPTTVVTKCDWNTCLQQVVDDKGTGHLRKLLLLALQRLDMNTTDEYKEFKEKLIKMLESNYSLYQVFQEEVLKQLNRKYIPQVKLAEADFVEIINDDEHKKDLEEMRVVYDIYSDIPSKTME